MKYKIPILLIGLLFIAVACDKEHFSLKSKERRLTEKTWRMNSYVDHTLNECLDPIDTEYIFEENGDFVVMKADTVSYYSSWKLDNKKEYLTIGNNIFKLNLVTNKILSLRYGDVDIYYIPVAD